MGFALSVDVAGIRSFIKIGMYRIKGQRKTGRITVKSSCHPVSEMNNCSATKGPCHDEIEE
jgi:hypothetical protein